ncbi:MAG: hypothetical protein V4606_00415 [Patescibacteria group bacterium]
MSIEKLNHSSQNESDFEQRMQVEYISHIIDSLIKIEVSVTDLEDRDHLKDVLSQSRYDYEEMPESHMDESELAKEKEALHALAELVGNPELSNDQREELIKQRLSSWF